MSDPGEGRGLVVGVGAVKAKIEKVDKKLDNLDEDDPSYRRKKKLLTRRRAALTRKLKIERKRERLRQGFRGTPSSYRHFTYSGPVNARTKNHQDIEPYDPWKLNPFFPKQMQRQRANTVQGRARRQARAQQKLQKEQAELHQHWKGVPYTNKKLSFSSTANLHIKNLQEYGPITSNEPDPDPDLRDTPKAHEHWNMMPDKEEDLPAPRYSCLVNHDQQWVGSPSSYEVLTFSSSANKHIWRKQGIPGSRVTRVAPHQDDEPEWRKKERREQRWKLTGRGPPDRVKKERGWQGSPSTFDFTLTFSASANKSLHSKQELPKLFPLHPRPKPKKLTKKQRAKLKRIKKAKQRLENEFRGSPSSYRRLSYSKPANRVIRNHQDISDYGDPLELGFGERTKAGQEADRARAEGTGESPAAVMPVLQLPDRTNELEETFQGMTLTPRGTKEIRFRIPTPPKVAPYSGPAGPKQQMTLEEAGQLDVEGLQLSDEHICYVLDWQTIEAGRRVPENAFLGGNGGFSKLYFARAEVSDRNGAGSIVVVGQASASAEAKLQNAHLPLGTIPFEAKRYHILVVKNQPERASATETEVEWVPCRAGDPVPPGAISGDEQGSVYLARAAIRGNPRPKGPQGPQISFPGCVRAYLGEDGTTPCLHKADIPTNNNIVARQHFDVLCLHQYARAPQETFDDAYYGEQDDEHDDRASASADGDRKDDEGAVDDGYDI